MNKRFDIPEENAPIEMPESLEDKCTLAHKLLVKQLTSQGLPEEVAPSAAHAIIQTTLDDGNEMKEAAQLQFKILSAIHNN